MMSPVEIADEDDSGCFKEDDNGVNNDILDQVDINLPLPPQSSWRWWHEQPPPAQQRLTKLVEWDKLWERMWHHYARWVLRHQTTLFLGDQIVERLLWWFPPPPVNWASTVPSNVDSSSSHAVAVSQNHPSPSPQHHQQQRQPNWWQNVHALLWASLTLHRLATDLVLQQNNNEGGGREMEYGYDGEINEAIDHMNYYRDDGTTLQLPPDKVSFRIRIALTALQGLWPVLVCQSPVYGGIRTLERVRFLLRGWFLIRYWHRMKQCRTRLLPGLIQEGGLWLKSSTNANGGRTMQQQPWVVSGGGAPTLEQEERRLVRLSYLGKRTNQPVLALQADHDEVPDGVAVQSNHPFRKLLVRYFWNWWSDHRQQHSIPKSIPLVTDPVSRWRLFVGEFLYILRPLLWSEVQASASGKLTAINGSSSSWWGNAWTRCLLLDTVSLLCLASVRHGNKATYGEWNRRRFRLLLYFLRSPVWDEGTQPAVQRCSSILHRFLPGLGALVSWYLQDWVYYWKLYRLEEG